MYGGYLVKKCILSFKWPKDGMHTYDTNRWHINIAITLFHASSTYLWYGCNNVTYSSYDTYNTCVPYVLHMAHIVKWEQIVLMRHVEHGAYGTHGTCGTFGGYGACGTCVTYVDDKCGTFVANVACGIYVTHVPYLQMVHTSMDLPNEYKHTFTSGSKNKIRPIPNVQDFVRSCAYE